MPCLGDGQHTGLDDVLSAENASHPPMDRSKGHLLVLFVYPRRFHSIRQHVRSREYGTDGPNNTALDDEADHAA